MATRKPIGFINEYDEIKVPPNLWKYIGKEGLNHRDVKLVPAQCFKDPDVIKSHEAYHTRHRQSILKPSKVKVNSPKKLLGLPIGYINDYDEIKVPPNIWKYIGKEGLGHRNAKLVPLEYFKDPLVIKSHEAYRKRQAKGGKKAKVSTPKKILGFRLVPGKKFDLSMQSYFSEFIQELKDSGFLKKIRESTMVNLLEGKEISSQVEWYGSLASLNFLVNTLIKKNIVENNRSEKWKITARCFVWFNDKKKGVEFFDHNRIRTVKGSKTKKTDKIRINTAVDYLNRSLKG